MNKPEITLILASGSPRRKQLLADLQIKFEVRVPNIPEVKRKNELPRAYVRRLSLAKATVVADQFNASQESSAHNAQSWCILSADTIVVLGKEILEKPSSEKDALRMLKKLSGKSHQVLTGFCLLTPRGYIQKVVETRIRFAKMPDVFWKWYVSTGEPMDKAGAYAAQGGGMSFIQSVQGSYSNVVGLPLVEVLEAYQKLLKKNLYELR